MSNEVRVSAGLQVVKNSLRYYSQPSAFTADMTGQKGPVPGAITVTPDGNEVDLSQLTRPSWCRISSLETSGGETFEYGIWDPDVERFYIWGEVQPGHSHVFQLSRNFGEYYEGTGTGTSPSTNLFWVKAMGESNLTGLIEAFEA